MGRRRQKVKKINQEDVKSPTGIFARDQKERLKLLDTLFSTVYHFFGDIKSLFSNIFDFRNQSMITYNIPTLSYTGVLLYIFQLGARRRIAEFLRNNSASSEKFKSIFGVDQCPHGDTLNYAFAKLDWRQYQEVICEMVSKLIRKKVLYPYRLFKKYYVIAIDGTGMVTYPQRHCPGCIKKEHKGKTIYYHDVLEAKIVTKNGFSFSIMSEFIENVDPEASKQDCELKAFYRLTKKLKKRFPRLPILLSLDGLYAGGPTFALCKKNNWKYMICLKDDDLSTVNEEFESLAKIQSGNQLFMKPSNGVVLSQKYNWVEDIEYIDSNRNKHLLTVLQCLEKRADKKNKKYKWLTNVKITNDNVVELADKAGRIRWKIENEGFNVQKNCGYNMEHPYSKNPNSAKIFYYLMQIAHIIHQLIIKGNLIDKITQHVSFKSLAYLLLEAWRICWYGSERLKMLKNKRFQIRFDTS